MGRLKFVRRLDADEVTRQEIIEFVTRFVSALRNRGCEVWIMVDAGEGDAALEKDSEPAGG